MGRFPYALFSLVVDLKRLAVTATIFVDGAGRFRYRFVPIESACVRTCENIWVHMYHQKFGMNYM